MEGGREREGGKGRWREGRAEGMGGRLGVSEREERGERRQENRELGGEGKIVCIQ